MFKKVLKLQLFNCFFFFKIGFCDFVRAYVFQIGKRILLQNLTQLYLSKYLIRVELRATTAPFFNSVLKIFFGIDSIRVFL